MFGGSMIGPFVLDVPLAAGGGVWRARDTRDGAIRALKLAPLHDRPACARLRNESELAGSLEHRHVLRPGEAGVDRAAGAAWLAMECLPGTHAPRTPAAFRQLLLALGHLHEHQIVHCDVKPANLLAARDGSLKLADFGLARRARQGIGPMRGPMRGQLRGPVHGTPRYMAPERLRGGAPDPRGDLFAAGVVLFELATGRPPFDGTPFEILSQVLRGPLVPAAAAGRLAPLLRRALAADPAARFAGAADFLAAYDAIGHATL
jgi:serine/threonine protein kinase